MRLLNRALAKTIGDLLGHRAHAFILRVQLEASRDVGLPSASNHDHCIAERIMNHTPTPLGLAIEH
ncbi:hypothetical protein LMG29542_07489 [Paraburkholderia humisilvae]|uniref:Uncharacterized protein n=1 Tax=Paraburkholderia humisilvae TaxID=627669 RepID=A0A6J5F9J8_9BURK|nr:hypothetical protein LMG29542_07489 [Paraburkholderia humisilvae]